MYANELAADCKHGCKKSVPAGEIEALAGNERNFCNHIESVVRADRLHRVQTGSDQYLKFMLLLSRSLPEFVLLPGLGPVSRHTDFATNGLRIPYVPKFPTLLRHNRQQLGDIGDIERFEYPPWEPSSSGGI